MHKVKKLSGIIALFLSFHMNAFADPAEALAVKYSDTYGWLSILLESNEKIDLKCQSSTYRSALKNEADFILRSKTGYSYHDWATQIADPNIQALRVDDAVSSILTNIGGCNHSKLEQVAKVSLEKVELLLLEMTTFGDLDYLDIIVRSEKEIKEKLDEKLKDFTNLSLEEAEYLVSVLESGYYSYALYSLPVKVKVDKEKASSLKLHIKNRKLAIN